MNKAEKLKVFVSYSWDSDEHRDYVKNFVNQLCAEGLDVIYDGNVGLGDRLPQFMEESIRDADYVIFMCTPHYKERADARKHGVGYENTLITGELYDERNERKFIPVLISGSRAESIPYWAKGKNYVDLRGYNYTSEAFRRLVEALKKKAH